MLHQSMFLLCLGILSVMAKIEAEGDHDVDPKATIYQFHAEDIDGKNVSMDKYRGKVVIIVNVASECGLTKTNYLELKELLGKYKSQGLRIAAFPCNQFNSQEPGSNAEIKKFVHDNFNFDDLDLYAKIDVNGANTHPLYTFLKQQQPGTLFDTIKWNFTKFIVDRSGRPISRFAPTTSPSAMVDEIEVALRGAQTQVPN